MNDVTDVEVIDFSKHTSEIIPDDDVLDHDHGDEKESCTWNGKSFDHGKSICTRIGPVYPGSRLKCTDGKWVKKGIC